MLDKKENKLRRILHICSMIYAITLVASLYMNYVDGNMSGIGMSVLAIFTPLIVPIIFYVLHFKPVYEIYIISTVFTYFASLVGSGFHWYSYAGFDKVLHFISGWLFTTLAIILFFYIRKSNSVDSKEDRGIFLIFINAVNMTVAVLWEFYEYAMLIFFNNDCINHYSQGVHDSITDMLCAAVAGILLTYFIIQYLKKGKRNFFVNVYEKFYERNIAHDEKNALK